MSAPHLSLIVPAFNEAERLAATAAAIMRYLDAQAYRWELIFVLDGGRPGAAQALAAAAAHPNVRVLDNGVNRGKGYSVRAGAAAARGARIAFIDADLSIPVQSLAPLLGALYGGADVAIGSRALGGSSVSGPQPLMRQSMGSLFNLFVRTVALPGLRDTQCGFKGFRREAAHRIFAVQRIDRFGFDVEVLYLARRMGLAVREIPVTCVYHGGSSVGRVGDSLAMALDVVRVRVNAARGLYGR
jgi:dolichyl-phosphate beta-glucosyltransferase